MKDNKELFMLEYLCKWDKPLKEYNDAYKLWVKYYYECERFDQFVCTGSLDKDGFSKPMNAHERTLINRNASSLLNSLYETAHIMGLRNEDLKLAKQDAIRLTPKGLEEEYRRLFNANKT